MQKIFFKKEITAVKQLRHTKKEHRRRKAMPSPLYPLYK